MGAKPSIATDPSRPMQVIGAGFCRTGTMTFALAMEKLLDGPAYHGGCQIIGREDSHVKLIHDAMKYRHDHKRVKELLKQMTAGYVAVSDAPGCCLLEDLVELYPDVPVICITRDRDKWWKSFEPVFTNAQTFVLDYLLFPIPSWRWFPACADMFVDMAPELYGVPLMCPELIDQHTEYVKRVVPKERLHFVSLSDGWKPFCEILGKPIPDGPLPHVNDAKAADQVFQRVVRQASAMWAGGILGLGAVTFLASFALRNKVWR